MDKTLGARIASLRKQRGYKQDEVAEKLGVSPQAVSKWENDVSAPDIMTLPALASMLKTTVDHLLTGDEANTPETLYVKKENRSDIDDLVLKIRIDDGSDHIKVNLPIALLKAVNAGPDVMNKMNVKTGGMSIDWDQIMTLVENGVVGKLVEVESEDGTQIVVFVE